MVVEAAFIAVIACFMGWAIVQVTMLVAASILSTELGIWIEHIWLTPREFVFFLTVILTSCLATLIPAFQLYRHSLKDGMTVQQ